MKNSETKTKQANIFLKINQMLWKKPGMRKVRKVFFVIDSVLLATIKKPKNNRYEKKKVLIVYNMALGDGIMFLWSHRNLRELYPSDGYEITMACQKGLESIYSESGIYDKVLSLDYMSAAVNLRKRRQLLQKLREVHYDIVLDPVGCESYTTNIFIARAAAADYKVGVLDERLPLIQTTENTRKRIYNKVIKIDKGNNLHLVAFYCDFFKRLGVKDAKITLPNFPQKDLSLYLPQSFYIIFPSASMNVKRWSADNFAFIAQKIYETTKMPLVVCGTKRDSEYAEELTSMLSGIPIYNYIGKTDILQFVELIGRASLVITNDTSAYHIAVAKQVATVLICGGYTYDRYAFYDYEKQGFKNPYLIAKKSECFNCNNFCRYSDFKIFPCVSAISSDYAWTQINAIIEKEELKK